MNKYLVRVYVPLIEETYDVFIPNSKRIVDIIYYICSIINNLTDGVFSVKSYKLINRDTGNVYDYNSIISETDIKNGTELIIM